MSGFDQQRSLAVLGGAVALAPAIRETVGRCLDADAQNLFFMGTGGAAILMQPAALLLQQRSSFPVHMAIAAELITGGHQALGPKSLVVIPSVSGTTKESVETLAFCKARGATIITLVGNGDTPLGQMADHTFVNAAADDTASENFYIQSLLVALSVMAHRGEFPQFGETVAELASLPDHLLAAKTAFVPEAIRIAERLKDDAFHIITGAGGSWAPAWYLGMCVLEEQQWLRTRPVHAADFFHGTFELVEPGVSVVVLKGEDRFRPLADRVENFARRYTDRVTIIDTADCAMAGLPPETRVLVSPAILATLLERLVVHLAAARNHPLDTRRYYRRVNY